MRKLLDLRADVSSWDNIPKRELKIIIYMKLYYVEIVFKRVEVVSY